MSLGSDALQWLNKSLEEQPPKGWYCVKDIAEKKHLTVSTVKRQLDTFVKEGQIKKCREYKVGGVVKTYYDLTGFKF